MNVLRDLKAWGEELAQFPWRNTALTLAERFREDRLGLSASSLTFTTTIALVPLFTVALALFTAFPMFGKLHQLLQAWLVESLIPENIARQVLGYLTQFANKANRLGVVGLGFLFVTALSLVFTIDRTFNSIWRVRRRRPWGQRLLIYWAAITFGPLLLGASLAISSYLVSVSSGLVPRSTRGVHLLLDLLEFAMMALALAAAYRHVPNTAVRWRHAATGGLFAAVGIDVAKRLLAVYLGKVPTYSAIYGAFATLPILLIWIYVAWVIVLFGAVIAAYLPSLLAGVSRRPDGTAEPFHLALEVLQQLLAAREGGEGGRTAPELAAALRIDPLRLQTVMEALQQLDWVARLEESDAVIQARYALLVDPQRERLAPLIESMLIRRDAVTEALWQRSMLETLRLADALEPLRGDKTPG